MRLKRFITNEENQRLLAIVNNEKLQSNEAYTFIDKANLSDKDKEDFEYVNNILGSTIEGFYKFKSIVEKKLFRIEYNYNYDNDDISFSGVGYISIEELKNGFQTI